MEKLNKKDERRVTRLMAKEFLDQCLGVEPTMSNIHLMAKHIIEFEWEVRRYKRGEHECVWRC